VPSGNLPVRSNFHCRQNVLTICFAFHLDISHRAVGNTRSNAYSCVHKTIEGQDFLLPSWLSGMSFHSAFIGFLTALILFLWSRRSNASRVALPPGPKPTPILGNIRDIPSKQPWLFATKLAKIYGRFQDSVRNTLNLVDP